MTSSKPTLKTCGQRGEMPKLTSLAKEAKDAKVIIALGTNSLGFRTVDEHYLKLAQALSAESESCFWVGPPHLDPAHESLSSSRRIRIKGMDSYLTDFYSLLKVQLGNRCAVVDSRESTQSGNVGNGTVDGIHRRESAGKFWAQSVFPKL
jgi:hypothetical protein